MAMMAFLGEESGLAGEGANQVLRLGHTAPGDSVLVAMNWRVAREHRGTAALGRPNVCLVHIRNIDE
jgi:hypothetical protein